MCTVRPVVSKCTMITIDPCRRTNLESSHPTGSSPFMNSSQPCPKCPWSFAFTSGSTHGLYLRYQDKSDKSDGGSHGGVRCGAVRSKPLCPPWTQDTSGNPTTTTTCMQTRNCNPQSPRFDRCLAKQETSQAPTQQAGAPRLEAQIPYPPCLPRGHIYTRDPCMATID